MHAKTCCALCTPKKQKKEEPFCPPLRCKCLKVNQSQYVIGKGVYRWVDNKKTGKKECKLTEVISRLDARAFHRKIPFDPFRCI